MIRATKHNIIIVIYMSPGSALKVRWERSPFALLMVTEQTNQLKHPSIAGTG